MVTRGVSVPPTGKGSERVKAWVYSAINPLLESLRAETILLSKKSISWRYNTEDMEFIVPTRNLISPSGRPNYDDMLRGYPGLRQQMDARDRKVEALLGDARSCWKTLTQYGGFKETVDRSLKQWREEGNPYPGGAVPEGEFWLLIAEHVMNNASDLPFHYTNRSFWSRFRQIFSTHRLRESFSQLVKSINALKGSDETLIETLDRARSKLCEEYDIAAAPL